MPERAIYTVGHSTRTLDELLDLLRAQDITKLADIRTVPKSRRHPQFSGDALSRSLPAAGIAYRHFPGLGGLRKPRPHSRNAAWRNDSFRGYADYMESDQFESALRDLIAWADDPADRAGRTAIMCAEAVWWRCHRQLVADALVVRGIEVRHIVSTSEPARHVMTRFAHVIDGRVTYPAPAELREPRLL